MSKPKGMSFDGESIRAFKAGRKTMTRRIVKPQPSPDASVAINSAYLCVKEPSNEPSLDCAKTVYCPDPPGTIVYAKETWVNVGAMCENEIIYRADEPDAVDRWNSPIYMPRWAARFWFRVTDVRAERLQDISIYDIRDEGLDVEGFISGFEIESDYAPGDDPQDFVDGARHEFAERWNGINAKRGHPWESNPWVWAYRLEPIERPEGM